jgi:hypothetical protein
VVAGVLFLLLAILCRQYFYHHPAHIGIRVQSGQSRRGTAAENFFLETNLHNPASATVASPSLGSQQHPLTPNKLTRIRNATIIDAFRFKA